MYAEWLRGAMVILLRKTVEKSVLSFSSLFHCITKPYFARSLFYFIFWCWIWETIHQGTQLDGAFYPLGGPQLTHSLKPK